MNGEPKTPDLTHAESVSPGELRMIKIPARLRTLKNLGEAGELVGLAQIYTGAAVVSLETCIEIEKYLADKIKEFEDAESIAKIANALSGILKSKASVIKSVAGYVSTSNSERKGRRSFAKGEKIGPVSTNNKRENL